MNHISNYDIKKIAEEFGTPVYVYDAEQFKHNYNKLKSALNKYYPKNDIHFSVKANSNLKILELFKNLGAGADCSSPNELRLANMVNFSKENILYTGNYESYEDLNYVSQFDVKLNLDDLNSFKRLINVRKPERISFRINPGIGRGGFEGITTAGSDAKFGIPYEKAKEAYKFALDSGVTRFGIHMMTGSNNLEPYYFAEVVDKLMIIAGSIFPELGIVPEYFDIGGGQGVPYYDDEKELNVDLMSELVAQIFREKCEKYSFGEPQLILEPGRYLAANAGYLITKVTGIKEGYKKFVGLDAGMGTLVRPSMYGAYHRSYVYGKESVEKEKVNLCGQICENSDIFAKNQLLPIMEEGDLLTFRDAGAYGFTMSSVYNNRTRPAEVLIQDGKAILIRRREKFEDMLNYYPSEILNEY
jgi:diaminopimelate decarboxylase